MTGRELVALTDLLVVKGRGLVYLASPYTKFPRGIDEAFRAAARAAGELLRMGMTVYSPIVHMHPIAIHCGLDPRDHNIWLPLNEEMIKASSLLVVAMLPTWEDSFGIEEEIKAFTLQGKTIYYLDCSWYR